MRAVRVTVLLAAAAAVAGCDSSGAPEPTPAPAHISYLSTDPPGVGDGALLEGTVVDGGGCLRVRSDSGTFTPVFATADLRVAGFLPGDGVSLGGGIVDVPPDGANVPPACSAGPYWLVVRPE